jgi:hypothetical protein
LGERHDATKTGPPQGIPPKSLTTPKWDPKNKRFRCRARRLLLTYAQTREDWFGVDRIRIMLDDMGAKCMISRETHKDGNYHHHVYVEHKDEKGHVTINDARALDITGEEEETWHPNIEVVKRTPEKVWDYVEKDGDIVWASPGLERPVTTRSNKRSLVWEDITTQVSKKAMLNRCKELEPKAFATSFNNIKSCADYLFPKTQQTPYANPDGLEIDIGGYPELEWWIDSYIGTNQRGRYPTPSDTGTELSQQRHNGLPEAGRVLEGEAGPAANAPQASNEESDSWAQLSRYEAGGEQREKLTNKPQERPKALILWGKTKLGKTLLARSLGDHMYCNNMFNMDNIRPEVLYAVFDDIDEGLKGFNYKGWLGGQNEFTTTDKYRHKENIIWGKPTIYISNRNPFEIEDERRIDLEWLKGNSVCVEIVSQVAKVV